MKSKEEVEFHLRQLILSCVVLSFPIFLRVFLCVIVASPGFLWGGGGGGGAFASPPPKNVCSPLSQTDLPHIQPHVFSCYPPRFLVYAIGPPLSLFLK